MAKKFGSFGKNVMKSTARTGLAVTRDLMPNLSRSVKENKDFVVTKYKEVKEKPKNSDIQSTFLYKTTKSLINNALEDLKSGNFNNEERQKKSETESFANMFGFDPNIFDIDDDFNFSSDSSDSNDINMTSFNVSADFSGETIYDIKNIARMSGTNLQILNLGMNSISYQVSALTNYYNENTTRFYETVETRLYEATNKLEVVSSYYKDLFENSRKGMSGSGNNYLSIFMGMQGLSIKEWMDLRKKANGDNTGVFSLIKDMAKSQYESLAANPLGYLSKSVMKSLIPKTIKNTMTRFDDMFGMAPMLLQGLSNSKNPIFKMFGNFFKLDKFKIKNKKYKYEKGPVPFDGITRRSITQVIPGYLSKILTAVSSRKNDKDLHYDYESGKFVTREDVKKKFDMESEDSMKYSLGKSGTKNLKEQALEKAKNQGLITNDEDLQTYSIKIDEAISNMSKDGKSFHSIKDVSEISNDSNIAELLKSTYTEMDVDTKRKIVFNMGNAFIDHQRFLEEAYANSMYQQAFDYGEINIIEKTTERAKFSDLQNKAKDKMKEATEKVEGKVKNNKLRKLLDFFNNDKENIVDKKLNDIYENILNPLANFDTDTKPSKKKKSKFKNVIETVKNIDKEDLKKEVINATPKRSSEKKSNKEEIEFNTNIGNQHKEDVNEIPTTSIISPLFTNMMNSFNNPITTVNEDKNPIVKIQIMGGSLDNIKTVQSVTNVDDVDDADAPLKGSASEQRKEMEAEKKEKANKKKEVNNNNNNNEEKSTLETMIEEAVEEKKESFFSNIIESFTGGNLLETILSSKLGNKASSLLGKTKIGKGISNIGLELATNPKGIIGGVKTLTKGGLGKVAGLAKMGSITSKVSSVTSTIGGTVSSAIPAVTSTVGSAIPGIATAATGALSTVAPFLLPGLAVAGVGYNIFRMFKKKPKKDKNGNIIYNKDGNPVMESTASKIGKGIKNFGKKLFGQTQKVDDEGNPIYDENGDPVYEKKPSSSEFLKNSPYGLYYTLNKKDIEDEELHSDNAKAKKKTLTNLQLVYKFMKSGNFKKIFGSNGLFISMSDGLLGKGKGALSSVFKKLFGTLFDSANANVTGASDDNVGSATPGSGNFGGSYWDEIFNMVGREESNNNPAQITDTPGDKGGKSYGSYQFSYAQGSLKEFVDWLGTQSDSKAKEYHRRLSSVTLASTAFDNEWKQIAKEDREGFLKLQQKRMKEAFYDIIVKRAKDKFPNFDPSKYTVGLNAVIMSTAIQFGAYTNVLTNALKKVSNINDEPALLAALRDERIRQFPYTKARYEREYKTSMELYNKYKGKPFGDGSGGGAGGATSPNAQVQIALYTAKAMIDAGYPYRLESGACDPSYGAFDCSGLMQYSYKKAGITIPRDTYSQVKSGTGVPINGEYGVGSAKPGDLLLCRPDSRGPGHVMMYAGNQMVYEAASSKTGLVNRHVSKTSFASSPVAIRRIVNQGVNSFSRSSNKIDNVGVSENQFKNMRHNENNNLVFQLRESLKKYSKTSKKRNEILTDIISAMKDIVNK